MEVLLVKDVPGLGQVGEVKRVADGYAQNFLIPKGLAVLATKGALKQAHLKRQAEERRQQRIAQKAERLAELIIKTTLTFRAKAGEEDRLYGSITSADIAEALEREIGEPIDKRKIELEEPIRELGTHRVPIQLATNLAPAVTVVVEKEE